MSTDTDTAPAGLDIAALRRVAREADYFWWKFDRCQTFADVPTNRFVQRIDPPTILALLDELERTRADSRRLDWLDERNRGLNAYCGTTYHWKLTLSHLVTRLSVKFPDGVDLHDSEPHGFKSCREAIDAGIEQVRKEPPHAKD